METGTVGLMENNYGNWHRKHYRLAKTERKKVKERRENACWKCETEVQIDTWQASKYHAEEKWWV